MIYTKSMHNEAIVEAYKRSFKRLLLLDYDGVLAPIVELPELAAPSAEVLALLKKLVSQKYTTCVIISGRQYETLEDWLGDLSLGFTAEHGLWRKEPYGPWKQMPEITSAWTPDVKQIMTTYEELLPGSFIEQKTASVGLHYRKSDQAVATRLIERLIKDLQPLAKKAKLHILHGKKVVELVPLGVDKGVAAKAWLAKGDWDFVLAAGDDVTDESMFESLPSDVFTIKVGKGTTAARYRVETQTEFITLLQRLAAI
jgi:trehalose 6-phosphate synthase/phosphatase